MKPAIPATLRVLGAGAAAAAVLVGSQSLTGQLDLARAGRSAAPSASAPVASAEAICSGQELAGVSGVRDVLVPENVAAAAAPQALLAGMKLPPSGQIQLPTGRQPLPIEQSRGRTLVAPVPGGGLIRAIGVGGLAPGLAATQEWSAQAKDLRGLASAPCGTPAPENWLIGGGADPGRQERLVLVNPGANEVTADIEVLGATGIVSGSGGSSAVVPARGRKVLLLDAIAPSEQVPVVHVTATGGSLWATLSDTWLDGSIPAGAETATPTAEPDRRLVLPGINLNSPVRLRVASTGDQEAVVSVRLLGPKGGTPIVGPSVVRVAARSVKEIPLKASTAGTYAVEVRADEPVVASILTSARDGVGPGDFAWSTATDPIEGVAGLPLPVPTAGQALTRSLSLAASSGAVQATVTLVDGSGAETSEQLNIPADSSLTISVKAPTAVWVRRDGGSGELHGSLISAIGRGGTRLLSSMPLADSPLTSAVSRAYPVP